jgi:hypothetical protein
LVKMDVWRSEDIAYLLTHSTQHSPSWEAGQFSQLTKKFPAFYTTRRFFTVLTRARHLSLSIQSPRPHPTSWTSILITCMWSVCFLSDTLTKSVELCQVPVSHSVTLTEHSAAPDSHSSRTVVQTGRNIVCYGGKQGECSVFVFCVCVCTRTKIVQ